MTSQQDALLPAAALPDPAAGAGPAWPQVDAPVPGSLPARLAYYARLAPSTHNAQPWKFIVGPAELDVIGDDRRWPRIADADRREYFISLGCAIEAARITADHAGHDTAVHWFPVAHNATLVARIRIGAAGTRREDAAPAWFAALLRRRTSRRAFAPDAPVSEADRRVLYTAFTSPAASLHFLAGSVLLGKLAQLERSADLALLDTPGYREELAQWLGEGRFGASWLGTKVAGVLPRLAGVGAGLAEEDAARVASAPLAVLLTSRADTPLDQVLTGAAYLRVALAAECLGLRVQPASQVLEWPQTRRELAQLAGLHERFAQHLLRIGHAPAEPPVHRRLPLAEVMLQAG